MVKNKKIDKYISISIRCQDYSNRKEVVTKRVKNSDGSVIYEPEYDEQNNLKLKQVWIDLPGTLKDEENFKKILDNFQVPEDDWTTSHIQATRTQLGS